jgi:hypothetical protein
MPPPAAEAAGGEGNSVIALTCCNSRMMCSNAVSWVGGALQHYVAWVAAAPCGKGVQCTHMG